MRSRSLPEKFLLRTRSSLWMSGGCLARRERQAREILAWLLPHQPEAGTRNTAAKAPFSGAGCRSVKVWSARQHTLLAQTVAWAILLEWLATE